VLLSAVPHPHPDTCSTGTGSGSSVVRGLLFGLSGQFAQIPANVTQIGMISDSRVDQSPGGSLDRTVQLEINKAATASGRPAEVITVNRVTIEET